MDYFLVCVGCVGAPLRAALPRPQDDHERHEQEEHQRRVYDPITRIITTGTRKKANSIITGWMRSIARTQSSRSSINNGRKNNGNGVHQHEEHEEHEHDHQ
jgi:hypothetical protein